MITGNKENVLLFFVFLTGIVNDNFVKIIDDVYY